MGQHQTGIYVNNYGTIAVYRRYVCGNYNSTHYYAQNNVTGNYEQISTDAVQTISYALSKLTLGRTWQEIVLLRGNFSIYTTLTLSVGNVLLDCSQAQLNLAANTILLDVHPGSPTQLNDTIVGGHWIGRAAGSNTAIQFMYALNCTLKDANIEGFPQLWGAVSLAYKSGGITVQNCWIHNNGAGSPCINIGNSGNNRIINCRLGDSGTGIMVNSGTPANQILGCEFYGWRTGSGSQQHGIYLDGVGLSDEGKNIVSRCEFHDPHDGAGILVKSQNNTIYNNAFYNFLTNAAVGLSIYSQYNPCTANDNNIYDNTFTNMYYGFWLGQDASFCLSPTLRNRIHDGIFRNVTNCITFMANGAACWVNDTAIYYNNFSYCSNALGCMYSTPYVANTVIAYNDFTGAGVSSSIETKCVNTMVYGNIGLPDFNVPADKPIPPPP
jgi:hypothetical protein